MLARLTGGGLKGGSLGNKGLLCSALLSRSRSRFLLFYSSLPKASKRANVPSRSGSEIPPPTIHRVTYEYPPPPKRANPVPAESSAWRRHVPLLIGVGGLLWAAYAFNYFFGNGGSSEQTVLTPTRFTTYKITCKEDLSSDVALIELSPKFTAGSGMLKSGATLWNGKKLWSIQVKHPLVQIVRNYTPLPLYYMQSGELRDKPLLRVMGTASDEGRMCLLVKRYADGEMSRYLHDLPVGADVEIRGPFIEHKFPYDKADMQAVRQPMLDIPTRMPAEKELDPAAGIPRGPNVAFFTAGTGIAPALQALLSPNNPPRGFTNVYYSVRERENVPFERLMLFLESAGRARFHVFVDQEGRFIGPENIAPPAPYPPEDALPVETLINSDASPVDVSLSPQRKYGSVVQQYSDRANRLAYLPGNSQAIVCGPPGYIAYVAGDPGLNGASPIGGLLGDKGWTSENTVRMSDI